MVPVAVGRAQPEGKPAPAGILLRKSFKYHLYPTRKQALALEQQLGEARHLYNAALQERRDAWRHGVSLNYYDQANQLKDIRDAGHLALANFSACQDVLRRVDRAFKAFFRRVKAGEKPGYPRFKPRDRFGSFTFPAWGDGCGLGERHVRIQGVGLVKVKLHRPIAQDIKTLTLKQQCGRWYAVFSCVVEASPLPPCESAVGIDVGLESFATTSDGEHIPNPRYLREAQESLARAQQRLSRRKKGSHRRRKAARLVARHHERVKERRRDFHHKVARRLVNTYGVIAVEDLRIPNMVRNHHLARSISDAGWGEFISILLYKAEEADREVILVNPSGTSRVCSRCGAEVSKDLSERWHRCPWCGLSIHRDLNASRNILRLGRSLRDKPREAVCFSDRVVTCFVVWFAAKFP